MTNQQPITEVVLRCRDCGQHVAMKEAYQVCQSFQCKAKNWRDPIWSGWEIAHITRAEQAA